MTRAERMKGAIFVAMGCTSIKTRTFDEAMESAEIIARFVELELLLIDEERAKYASAISKSAEPGSQVTE